MGLVEGGTYMSYLPNENRETDSNADAPGLREYPGEGTDGKGQTHSRAFENWLSNYRNRLDRVLQGVRGQGGIREDDGPSSSRGPM